MVAIFKVVLPLAALAILATVFLLSRGEDLAVTIPFAEEDIAERMRDQQVTAPFFSGTTPKGDEIMVTADLVRPGGASNPAEALNLSARITMVEGGQFMLRSETGTFDIAEDMARFSGNVQIETSTGYVLETQLLNTALSGVSGDSPGTVTGTGPIGTITAGQLQFGAKNPNGPVHMLFKNGVKLIYDPKQTE
jgi:lipopolysaccharide export system protein LptC